MNRVHGVTGFVYCDSCLQHESNVDSHSEVDWCVPAYEPIAKVSTAVSRFFSGTRHVRNSGNRPYELRVIE